MDTDELATLRRLLGEAENRREEAERQRDEADRRRDEAGVLATAARPQTLSEYLEACHQLGLAIQVVKGKTGTTQGSTTNPTGRIFPRRIIPWDDFAAKQEEIWSQLNDESFSSQRVFPSPHQLEYVGSVCSPVGGEIGLRHFERDTVENAVQKLVNELYNHPVLRADLGIHGTVRFDSHTNLGEDEESVTESLGNLSLDGQTAATGSAQTPLRPRPVKGKGSRADQFCLYKTDDGQSTPFLCIEYKAPHKLTLPEITTGLASEIQPARDVINQEGEGFVFTSRYLCAAVVTQLFSYMVGKGTKYGYVCTGEAFIFLYIPSDPTKVYYSLHVPNLDVMDDDHTRLHRTAVAQVFAFILGAIREDPPPLGWFDAARSLDTWAVEYDNVLRNIPETVRKTPGTILYKPQRWKGFSRSPILTRTRSSRRDLGDNHQQRHDHDDSDSPSPQPPRSAGHGKMMTRSKAKAKAAGTQKQGNKAAPGQHASQRGIRLRQYCSHQCLRGLALGGPMDRACPNFLDHRAAHPPLDEFRRLICHQLATDRGQDADCMAMGLSGLRGSLFKVRLTLYGYTLIAKGVQRGNTALLHHERNIYDNILGLQGEIVPVCLGTLQLDKPLYYDGRVSTAILLLSYAGRSLAHCPDQAKANMVNQVAEAFAELHRAHVLHHDAEARNVLCHERRLMIVDFERAEIRQRPALGIVSPNRWHGKRRRIATKEPRDDFAKEMDRVKLSISQCVAGS